MKMIDIRGEIKIERGKEIENIKVGIEGPVPKIRSMMGIIQGRNMIVIAEKVQGKKIPTKSGEKNATIRKSFDIIDDSGSTVLPEAMTAVWNQKIPKR